MIDCEKELRNAVEWLLKRLYEICVEEGILKKISKKQMDNLYFSFRCHYRDIDEDFISLTDISLDYGDICVEDLPVSWLWKKNWEQEFIKIWLEPCKKSQSAWEEQREEHDLKEYKRLHKKFGRRGE